MMPTIDYQRHNEEVRRLLALEERGTPERIRMTLACNPRMILSDSRQNRERLSFQDYFEDPQKMLEVQCRFQEYVSDSFPCDKIMGFENQEGVFVYPDMQNVLEAEYFGCEVAYHGFHEPGTKTCLTDENKYAFLEKEYPSIFSGLSGRALEYMSYFAEKKREGFTYRGKPISSVGSTGLSTDGPFTIACCLLGATEACIALYEEEQFLRELLSYITDGTINRIRALRRYLKEPERSRNFSFADDSVAMLSERDYRRFVLPFHQRLIDELTSDGTSNGIHLCGNASHLFPTLQRELNVTTFDTGFPVNHGQLVRTLDPGTVVMGGVHVGLLLNGSAEDIRAESRRILEEVKPYTRQFLFKEANNLSPGTSPENVAVMYDAAKSFGRYEA